MFTQPIAFIIGAGANKELNLPLGLDLLNNIASAVRFFDTVEAGLGLPQIIKTLFPTQIEAYLSGGRDLAKYIDSGVRSIDDALTWFSSRQEVLTLGKIAIVDEILKAERASPLYSGPSTIASTVNLSNTWMPHFLSMVMGGQKNEDADTAFGKLTIVNFNYDRALEHFLYSSLQLQYGLSETRARQIVQGLNLFRPYGTVDQRGGGAPFSVYDGLRVG